MTNQEMKLQMGRVVESLAEGHWQVSLYTLVELRNEASEPLRKEFDRLVRLFETEYSAPLYYALWEMHNEWEAIMKELGI